MVDLPQLYFILALVASFIDEGDGRVSISFVPHTNGVKNQVDKVLLERN